MTIRVPTRPTKGVLYVRGIPTPVKSLFKATCARRGEDMSKVIQKLMSAYVENPRITEKRK